MMRTSSSTAAKPFLLALEGPAGVGKTTLQNLLCQALALRGINAAALPEFSDSPLGDLLNRSAQYGQAKPSWTVELGGVLAFLADKVTSIEKIIGLPTRVWVSDRFVSSQLILGLNEIADDSERGAAEKIILDTMQWASHKFAHGSLLIILEAPVEVLAQRLEQRLNTSLLPMQRKLLEQETQEYRSLELSLPRFNQIRIDANRSIEAVANEIISLIPPQWAN